METTWAGVCRRPLIQPHCRHEPCKSAPAPCGPERGIRVEHANSGSVRLDWSEVGTAWPTSKQLLLHVSSLKS
eukprot:365252-Chlamydomonas_euryale.AAC.32